MEDLISKFYAAFNDVDADTMISCYHEDIIFEDPGFGVLHGERAKAMWQMLCASQKKGENFKIVASNIKANDANGSAHWEAYYNFSKTGRKVHNKIDAQFEFKDGLIINHKDDFNLHKWASQAMGIKGMLFGGMAFFKTKLHKQTSYLLDKYIEEKKLSK